MLGSENMSCETKRPQECMDAENKVGELIRWHVVRHQRRDYLLSFCSHADLRMRAISTCGSETRLLRTALQLVHVPRQILSGRPINFGAALVGLIYLP